MRLIGAKISGYKRLADDCEINLAPDPVCIVGPNAAGKSSFLDALVHLNHDQPFEHAERTRVPGGKTRRPYVQARFVLSDDDRELLKEIPEAANVRQLLVTKEADKTERDFQSEPYARRDLSRRQAVREKLAQLSEDAWLAQTQAMEEGLEAPPEPLIGAVLDTAKGFADDEGEWLEDRVAELDALAQRLNFIAEQVRERVDAEESDDEYDGPEWLPLPEGFAGLPGDLIALSAYEARDHPNQQVIDALADRVPQFVKFDEWARKLEAEYDLNEAAPDPREAIHNFLSLAETSWKQALEVVQKGDKGWKKSYLENIDEKLKERAALVWRQSDVEVKVDLDGSLLTILLSMQEDDWIDLSGHSDGLQQFMALRAFIWRAEQEVKPIVLLDEADRHLHYDAQADLVGVFEEQQEAGKIIYTTHSAGCLPRDLGLGIRAIVPETEEVEGKLVQQDHSRAVNRFWTEGRGFSPLLLAMGAGAFAFSATQWAVITEGMSDALLLPTLIRQATGEERLGYQPVPSLAEATSDEIANFDLVGGRVACLVDGDEGGKKHFKRLTKHGFFDEQILFLGGSENSELAIEDLLDKAVYLKAVNEELKAWHGLEFPASELPEKGRSKAVEDWCAQQTGEGGGEVKLSKVDVAQRVLDQLSPKKKLLAKEHRKTLKDLHKKITDVFEGAPERMKKLRLAAKEAEDRERI